MYHHPFTPTQNPFSSGSSHSISDYTQTNFLMNDVFIKEVMYCSVHIASSLQWLTKMLFLMCCIIETEPRNTMLETATFSSTI